MTMWKEFVILACKALIHHSEGGEHRKWATIGEDYQLEVTPSNFLTGNILQVK